MDFYRLLLRPLIFHSAPENAQKLSDWALRHSRWWTWLLPRLIINDERLEVNLAGIHLSNPVGLAAGYDKNCRVLVGLSKLGFGHLVGGTVFPIPRSGNPQPRILRYPEKEALVNSLGFPSNGVKTVVDTIEASKTIDTHLFISITGLSVQDFLQCHDLIAPVADAIELNISSPNTEGLQIFQQPEQLDTLLSSLDSHRRKPLFVKLPPFFEEQTMNRVFALIHSCLSHKLAGVVVSNTHPIPEPRLAVGHGGLSGRPLLEHTIRMVKQVRQLVGDRLTIIASGGIFTGSDTWRALEAGANSVQIFTGLVYRGPTIVREINIALLKYLTEYNIPSVQSINRTSSP